MRDIVATIQAEQDEMIRLDRPEALVIKGGPGTGKTVVTLYRVILSRVLGGASVRQLSYWRSSRSGAEPLLRPEFHKPRARVSYSFRDVLALRTFVYLRTHNVPLAQQVIAEMVDILAAFKRMQGSPVVPLFEPESGVRVDPEVRGGYPVIEGTRVPYDLVAGLLADGMTAAEVAAFSPSVTPKAARGALAFARYVDGHRGLTAA